MKTSRPYQSSPLRLDAALQPPAGFMQTPSIALEIGCGVGLHPIQYALKYPDRNLIAIEHTKEKFESFRRRFDGNHAPKNLWPVHANAITYIDQFIARETLDQIFLLYPNPNPKRQNQRWFRMPFFAKLIEVLKPEGRIVLATNIKSYAVEAEEFGTREWGLELNSKRILNENETGRTHFELKYLKRGEECTELVFAKNSRSSSKKS